MQLGGAPSSLLHPGLFLRPRDVLDREASMAARLRQSSAPYHHWTSQWWASKENPAKMRDFIRRLLEERAHASSDGTPRWAGDR